MSTISPNAQEEFDIIYADFNDNYAPDLPISELAFDWSMPKVPLEWNQVLQEVIIASHSRNDTKLTERVVSLNDTIACLPICSYHIDGVVCGQTCYTGGRTWPGLTSWLRSAEAKALTEDCFKRGCYHCDVHKGSAPAFTVINPAEYTMARRASRESTNKSKDRNAFRLIPINPDRQWPFTGNTSLTGENTLVWTSTDGQAGCWRWENRVTGEAKTITIQDMPTSMEGPLLLSLYDAQLVGAWHIKNGRIKKRKSQSTQGISPNTVKGKKLQTSSEARMVGVDFEAFMMSNESGLPGPSSVPRPGNLWAWRNDDE